MTDELESREPHRSAFAPRPASIRLGRAAAALLSSFVRGVYDEPATPEDRMLGDYGSLSDMAGFEARVTDFCLEPEIPEPEREALMSNINGKLAIYHEALPFNDGERRWLSRAINALPEGSHRKGFRPLQGMEAQIVSGGLRRLVKGGDLLRRWSAWRSQLDEYEQQGTFDTAHLTLASLVLLLRPAGEHWPSGYEDLLDRARFLL